jgi:hypothetical protein
MFVLNSDQSILLQGHTNFVSRELMYLDDNACLCTVGECVFKVGDIAQLK